MESAVDLLVLKGGFVNPLAYPIYRREISQNWEGGSPVPPWVPASCFPLARCCLLLFVRRFLVRRVAVREHPGYIPGVSYVCRHGSCGGYTGYCCLVLELLGSDVAMIGRCCPYMGLPRVYSSRVSGVMELGTPWLDYDLDHLVPHLPFSEVVQDLHSAHPMVEACARSWR